MSTWAMWTKKNVHNSNIQIINRLSLWQILITENSAVQEEIWLGNRNQIYISAVQKYDFWSKINQQWVF